MTLLFTYNQASAAVNTTRHSFHLEDTLDGDFDDIRIVTHYNLDEFLQIGSSSPCQDTGITPGVDADHPDEYRDFADRISPLDGPNDADTLLERDRGANEYAGGASGLFWWTRF